VNTFPAIACCPHSAVIIAQKKASPIYLAGKKILYFKRISYISVRSIHWVQFLC